MRFITTQPLWVFAVVLVVLTALSMCGPYMIRRRVELERLRTNNEVAGFKFATVGVLYAVLLAFAIIVVWQKFDDADSAVAREAGAAANIYRLSYGMGEPSRTSLRDHMSAYLHAVIDGDWPAMAHGGESDAATQALNAIYNTLLADHSADRSGTVVMTEILEELNQVTSARRERLVMSTGVVPGILWLVLFGGAALTISFTFFFGTENVRAQALMTGILSLLILGGLLIIIAVDYPFTGPVRVDPAPLELVLTDFGKP
jgi:hypothetical protein